MQPELSDRIYAARLFCVLFMMYVHVPNGMGDFIISYTFEWGRFDHWVEAFLIEGPGRASAALLSLVSGYLVALSLGGKRASPVGIVARRFISTLLPMMFWGALILLVYSLISQYRSTFLDDYPGWLDRINVVLFLTDVPYGPTMHLAFLRDLFVCAVLSPLLLVLLRRAAWPLLIVLAWVYLFHHDVAYYPVLRPLVLFSFALGMLLALRLNQLDALDRYWAFFLAISVITALVIMWVNGGGLSGWADYFDNHGLSLKETVLYPVCRLSGSLAIWTLLPRILTQRVRSFVKRYSAYVFAAFCSHYLMLSIVFNALWMPLLGERDSPLYLIWFIAAPFVALLLAVCIVQIAMRISPYLALLITGGRLQQSYGAQSPARLGKEPGIGSMIRGRFFIRDSG